MVFQIHFNDPDNVGAEDQNKSSTRLTKLDTLKSLRKRIPLTLQFEKGPRGLFLPFLIRDHF